MIVVLFTILRMRTSKIYSTKVYIGLKYVNLQQGLRWSSGYDYVLQSIDRLAAPVRTPPCSISFFVVFFIQNYSDSVRFVWKYITNKHLNWITLLFFGFYYARLWIYCIQRWFDCSIIHTVHAHHERPGELDGPLVTSSFLGLLWRHCHVICLDRLKNTRLG